MSEENVKQELTSNELIRSLMGVSKKNTRMNRLLCKILGHKYGGFSIDVRDSLIKSTTWYCERCGHEEVAEVKGDTDRLDIAVGLSMGMLG